MCLNNAFLCVLISIINLISIYALKQKERFKMRLNDDYFNLIR